MNPVHVSFCFFFFWTQRKLMRESVIIIDTFNACENYIFFFFPLSSPPYLLSLSSQ